MCDNDNFSVVFANVWFQFSLVSNVPICGHSSQLHSIEWFGECETWRRNTKSKEREREREWQRPWPKSQCIKCVNTLNVSCGMSARCACILYPQFSFVVRSIVVAIHTHIWYGWISFGAIFIYFRFALSFKIWNQKPKQKYQPVHCMVGESVTNDTEWENDISYCITTERQSCLNIYIRNWNCCLGACVCVCVCFERPY